jgi:hypothetical protein
LFTLALLLPLAQVAGQDAAPKDDKGETAAETTSSSSSKPTTTSSVSKAPSAPHVAILKDAKAHSGMFTLYQKGSKLYAEMSSSQYSSEYIVLISIARGIGQRPILGGYSWGFGDDWVWTFRKVDDRVHLIRKNVRFKANTGYPEKFAVDNAYTDSVIQSLRIVTKGPKGGDLVDMTPLFMSDLPQISQFLSGFGFSSDRSTWASVKALEKNVELEVAATYASSGRREFDTVADSRGVTINVHYSISKLSSSGYTSRMADDRIGYFLTVRKDYNKKSDRDQFVRYINRWKLQKPPGATKPPYPPKEPIIFWLEKTVPHKYRGPIRDGIAEWNKAFEKAGWLDAIEVRQQPDGETWDPEDIRYNTFRWITSDAGFAMGPSRVNPYTGEILDADIIFDADFLQYWKEEWETLTPDDVAAMTGGPLEPTKQAERVLRVGSPRHECRLNHGMARQMAFGAAAIVTRADAKEAAEQKEKLIMQGLKEVAMHEVGHTLGLRHNFKASKMLSLKDANDPEKTRERGMVGSVMDYSPSNIVPKEWGQGDYYTTTLGPYDYWAIEYGYKPLSGGTTGEVKELKKIAARSGDPALAYATDEDTGGFEPDPDANRFDLGSDALEYAKVRSQVVQEIMPTLLERTVDEGDDFTQTRRAFNILLAQHGEGMFFAARYVGGLHTSRSHKGDENARAPIEFVDVAKQREALALLEEQVFSDKPFQVPHELYKYLAKTNWNHWGSAGTANRKDYPIHGQISMWQMRVLDQLFSSTTLTRMHDTELKAPPEQDVLTTAELIERLTKAVFAELDNIEEGDYTNRKPAISSLRRNLQREYLRTLSNLGMGRTFAPDDCQTIAYAELSSLEARMSQMLKSNIKLDSYSRAHLAESESRIRKVLEARLSLFSP